MKRAAERKKEEESDRTQKPLNPSINSDFTPFHEPKHRSPNISLTKIKENQQKPAAKSPRLPLQRYDQTEAGQAPCAAPAQAKTRESEPE